MKHYYYYIEAGSLVDDASRFYKVAVGSGKQATRDYLFLLAHAVDHQYYFEKVSAESDSFMIQLAHSLDREYIFDLGIIHTDARALVRSIKANVQLSQSQRVLDATSRLRCLSSIDYRIAAALRR